MKESSRRKQRGSRDKTKRSLERGKEVSREMEGERKNKVIRKDKGELTEAKKEGAGEVEGAGE